MIDCKDGGVESLRTKKARLMNPAKGRFYVPQWPLPAVKGDKVSFELEWEML
jgi:hypothetical protein